MNNTIEQELYFLIFKYLNDGPCKRAAEVIREEIEKHNLLPKRIDWQGNEHDLDFKTFESQNEHIRSEYLLKIVSRIGDLLNQQIPSSSILSVNTLLGSGSQSLLRTSSDIHHHNESHFFLSRPHNAPLKPSSKKAHHYSQNIVNILNSRQVCGRAPTSSILPTHLYERFIRCKRLLGHLACVYCVSFDRTGRFIFTGADDMLIKIWSAEDSRLLATLRGHSGEITDLTVNYENTLLAAGSCDKMIRVWCIKTTQPICVLTGHTGMITSLKFCPYSRKDDRYLVSTSNDGSVCFWKWNVRNNQFDPKPTKFIERLKGAAHLICFSFSTGGSFMAVGSSDHYVRVYRVSGSGGPTKLLEIQPHVDQVDSLQFSNTGLRFVSGSKDGTAHIWRYERKEWDSKVLHMSETLPHLKSTQSNQEIVPMIKLKVTMVGWSLDDAYVITAVNDFSIKVWESNSARLKYILKAHEDEVYVIETHPTDPRIFLSGGHDGKIFIWDLQQGKHIKMFDNTIYGQGYGSIFDCKWSPDGSKFACTDSHGHLSIFGFGDGQKYKKVPDEVFFHTDYRPLIRDANHYAIDEQTQCAPHLMPPPFLVDIDGNPYPPDLQRLVPGREHCKDDQLVPYIAIQNERGVAEVLDPRDNQQQQPEPVNLNNVNINDSILNNSNLNNNNNNNDAQNQRPTIDDMIQRFQQEQERNRVNEEHGYAANSNNNDNNNLNESLQPAQRLQPAQAQEPSFISNRPGARRSGDVEGVRQSVGNWQSRGGINPLRGQRNYVTPLPKCELEPIYKKLAKFSEYEEEFFSREGKKEPISTQKEKMKEVSKKGRLTRRQKQNIIQRGGIQRPSNNSNRSANLSLNHIDEDPSIQSDDSDDTSFSIGAVESWQESSSSSENRSDSSDDDWQFSRTDPRSGRTKRKKQRASRNAQDDSDDEHVHQPVRTSSRPHREVQHSSRYNEDDENQPSTSSGTTRATTTKMTRTAKKANQLLNMIPEESFKPPEWLTETMPKRTPYFPQIGDELIYFRKGHSLYNEAVRKNKVYNLHHKQKLLGKKVADQQLVKVKKIEYEIVPPNMVILTLGIIDESGNEIGVTELRYHDMPDVIDFLVLKQFYDNSIRREWKPNDRFRSIIDNKWWFGKIKCIEQDEEYPNCEFQNIKVIWDNKEEENMSAWDLEPCTEEELSRNELPESLPISEEELERLMYIPNSQDWPDRGRDLECERLIRGLEKIMQIAWSEYFIAPVDLNDYPLYATIVAYPIDLSTIKTRLENRFYRSIDAVKFDVSFIERNARLFNESHSIITKNSKYVTYLCREFIDRQDCEDPTVIQQEIQQNKEIFESTDSESEEEHIVTRKKGKQAKNEPNWVTECKKFLNELFRNCDSEPFRTPVDLDEYDDYLSKVQSPMDLSTIKEQLLSGNYTEPKDLNHDLKLIFSNSKLYNTDKRSPIYQMTLRLQSLALEGMKKIINNHKQEQLDKQQKKSNTRLTNGRATNNNSSRTRRLDRNSSSTEPQPSSSRYQSNHYTNGHDRQTTQQRTSSRRRQFELEEDQTEDEEEDNEFNSSDYVPYRRSSRKSKRSRIAVPKVEESEATDLTEEEDEENFEVSIEADETEVDEQTEQEASDDEEYNDNRRSTRGSTKRKRQSSRKAVKKMKLTNGNSQKGRKRTSQTESDENLTETDQEEEAEDSSATDVDSSATVLNNSGSSSGRQRGSEQRARKSKSSNNTNAEDRYNSRSSRRKPINYRELNGSDNDNENEFVQQVPQCSRSGRLIKHRAF